MRTYWMGRRYPQIYQRDPFKYHGLILIPAWISNYIHDKVWGEISHHFPNFIGATVEVWE